MQSELRESSTPEEFGNALVIVGSNLCPAPS